MNSQSNRHRISRISFPLVWRLLRVVLFTGLFFAVVLFVMARILPLPKAEIPLATIIYDLNQNTVAKLFEQNRVEIPASGMSGLTRDAVVAIEDERFFIHKGIDPIAIARAVLVNIKARGFVEGGSTITQQLAKNLFLSFEKSISRKLKEAFITVQLETRFTKDEILTMYMNQVSFGHGAFGIEAASGVYFGKHADRLTLAESATLAGILTAPEALSPYRNPELALARRINVLDRMQTQGFISPEDAQKAKSEELELVGLRLSEAPYFIDYVMHEIRRDHPDVAQDILTAGYRITTSMDLRMQRAAEKAFSDFMPQGSADATGILQPQGALVAIDPNNGYIKAMVGGRDFSKSQYNRAYLAKRQPGSAMKPFLYTALIDMGYPPTSAQMCEEVEFPGANKGEVYKPTDYGNTPYHWRPLWMREALSISDNVVAVRWAAEIGPKKIVEYARRMGIESALDPNLSLALGTSEVSPLEMTKALCPLANLGLSVEPIAIIRITDRFGNTVTENSPHVQRVLKEPVAYVVTDMLSDVFAPGGTGWGLQSIVNRPIAGKTGTTEKLRDAWFVGYCPDLVASVYVGHDEPAKSVGGTGAAIAGPIWAHFMAEALISLVPKPFVRPAGVVELSVCDKTGLLPNLSCTPVREVFVQGTEPTFVDPTFHWRDFWDYDLGNFFSRPTEEDIEESLESPEPTDSDFDDNADPEVPEIPPPQELLPSLPSLLDMLLR